MLPCCGQRDIVTCAGLRLRVHRSCEAPRGERRVLSPGSEALGAHETKPRRVSALRLGSPGTAAAWDQPWALQDLWGQGLCSVLSPSCPRAMCAPNYVQPQQETRGCTQPIGLHRHLCSAAASMRVCPLPLALRCPCPAAWTGQKEEEEGGSTISPVQ